jgi:hypothetical protein
MNGFHAQRDSGTGSPRRGALPVLALIAALAFVAWVVTR